ncbi:hypothetical protein PoB_005318300 [Plakobranchus ocellatus]|uniref:Uncharacterized protein n=1 Tax=Plakobranchus ocellatus TaxID=259542 RepID=A0AAV4C435_9GAST|nr:hypothetical protein PoB_005318300 [Plakobranchus ocellatus]
MKARDDIEGEEFEDLTLFHADGSGGGQVQQHPQRKRKRKREKKESREDEEGEKRVYSFSQEQTEAELKDESRLAKRRKRGGEAEGDAESKAENFIAQPNQNLSVSVRKKASDSTVSAHASHKPKSLRLSSEKIEMSADTKLTPSSEETHPKKRKKRRKDSEQCENSSGNSNIGTNISSHGGSNPCVIDHDSTQATSKNANSNARSRSPQKSSVAQSVFSSPVEKVIYSRVDSPLQRKKGGSQKDNKAAKVQLSESTDSTSSNSEDARKLSDTKSHSPSAPLSLHSSLDLAESLVSSSSGRKSPKKTRNKSKSSSTASSVKKGKQSADDDSVQQKSLQPGSELKVSSSGEDGSGKDPSGSHSDQTAGPAVLVKSIFSSIKEKFVDPYIPAVAVAQSQESSSRSESSMDWSLGANDESSSATVADDVGDDKAVSKRTLSNTDPGPDRQKALYHFKGEDSSLTPYGKKKVVFDLRKNRANKFQDYIKSLRQQPDSPHVPEKSPSNSILKPGLSPDLSTAAKGGKKKLGKAKRSPKKKKKAREGSRSPSPGHGKLKPVRSRSDLRIS